MKVRNAALWCATSLLAAVAGTAPAVSAGAQGRAASARHQALPVCPPAKASTRAPTRAAGPATPGACRAAGHILESRAGPKRRGSPGLTPGGYHHLGANTAGEWSGVSGRMSVVDGSVRARSYDFVAGRFMVKRKLGATISWLEAGWAETGWAAPGRQQIYTFNTNAKTWQFYNQYTLRPGDKVWLDLHSDGNGVWSAWLWWGDRWNLLTAQLLPIGPAATIEQYVEVHVDSGKPGLVDVPPVLVDNVRVRPPAGGTARLWREDVPTLTGNDPAQRRLNGGFCLDWLTRYDTWTAGDCGR